jgi:LPXTG-site transpeptidase (sortase) family protein
MIIHWQWVIAAFLVGITLTLYLEIRRRRQITSVSPGLYLLPVLSLLLAVGVWLAGYETAATHEETAVFSPVILPTPTLPPSSTHLQSLPAPQISLRESEVEPPTHPSPTKIPLQTAVTRLRIPALKLNKPVRTIPLENGLWNVADLGSDVGWLETTAVQPDSEQAMVFVGHMTFANDNLLEQGAFADIPTLPYGTEVILETETGSHTYLIDFVRRVSPDDTDALYQGSGSTILLLTCADWNPQQGIYENRLLVRASKEK